MKVCRLPCAPLTPAHPGVSAGQLQEDQVRTREGARRQRKDCAWPARRGAEARGRGPVRQSALQPVLRHGQWLRE
jgi:hypothetical protein